MHKISAVFFLISFILLASCVQDKLDLSDDVSLDTEVGGLALTIPLGDGKPTYISSVVDFDVLQSTKDEVQDLIDQAALEGEVIDLTTIEYHIPTVHVYADIPHDDLDHIVSEDWKITTDFVNTVPAGVIISVRPLKTDGSLMDSSKIDVTVSPSSIEAGNGVDNPKTTSIIITLVANDSALEDLGTLDFEVQAVISNVEQAFKLEENQYVQFTNLVIYNNKPMVLDLN